MKILTLLGMDSSKGVADYGPGGQRYNDDLLLGQETKDRAEVEHPKVFNVLNWESLRSVFRPDNDAANEAKKRSHVAGFWAVLAAFLALVGAATEPLWSALPAAWPNTILILSALLGILAFLLAAGGLLYGRQKNKWLVSRLHTEQLRQLYFQVFVWQLTDIAESLNTIEGSETYKAKRAIWLNTFEDKFRNKGSARLAELLQPTGLPQIWLVPGALYNTDPIIPDSENLQDIFRAYEVFRFSEQRGYADYILRWKNRPFMEARGSTKRPFWRWYPGIYLPLRVKRNVLQVVWLLGISMLLLIHTAILFSHIFKWPGVEGPWPHVVVMVGALISIAAKTLSEGFALTREIERYEEYRAAVSGLHLAFRSAKEPQEKIKLMMEMERTAFEEMRAFLRSNSEATFVM